jgi:4-diphosphocytidyl-2-C-methyl-D-erythritol kinase
MRRGASEIVLAHAKLNLSLVVLAREEAGFHQIETLFCALELADEIEVSATGRRIHLQLMAPPEAPGSTPDLGSPQQNLAHRAAALFYSAADLEPGVELRLTKRIPAGGGLGGGSSDAAAVLNTLNRIHAQPLSRQRLLEIAARLGSDVPFFLAGSALALGWGRGTRLLPLPPLPSAPVLLAVPRERVATADAYADLAVRRGRSTAAAPAIIHPAIRRWEDAAAVARNDFEDVIFPRIPLLARLREALIEEGALMARMTGSGSTIFGIFDDAAIAADARSTLAGRFSDTEFRLTRTLTYHEG